ncbi:MAG TPA: ead/Ea22-like family protein [Phycisphaerae bacterium]|nr:ead/Ea22-like family protein [Phycisphaerae bacterium]
MSDAERRAERRRLAEAATPGPWEVRPGYHRTKWVVSVEGINYGENPAEDTAKHIFECDPATIIADLDRIAELEAEIAERDAAHRRVVFGACAPDELHCTCVPSLRAEIERLRAAIAKARLIVARISRSLDDLP